MNINQTGQHSIEPCLDQLAEALTPLALYPPVLLAQALRIRLCMELQSLYLDGALDRATVRQMCDDLYKDATTPFSDEDC